MSLKLGTTDINKAYIGSTEITKAYLGSTEVFGAVAGNGLLNNLLAYYEFENNVLDSHGSFNGTDFGTSDVAGKILRGRGFDGVNDYVDVGNIIGNRGQISISAWVYFDTITGIQPIMTDWATGVNEFMLRNNGGTLQWYLETNDGQFAHLKGTLTAGQWHHIVATYDGVEMNTYIDNVSTGTATAATGTIKSSPNDYIGRYSSFYLDGSLDELGVWEKGLTTTDISNLYNSNSGLAYSNFTT